MQSLEPFKKLFSQPNFSAHERLLGMLLDTFDAERGCLWLEKTEKLIYRGDESLRNTFPFSRSVFEHVLEEGKGFITFDPSSDDRIHPLSSMNLHNVRSALCAAARDAAGEVVAVAYFDNRISAPPFSENDLAFLSDVMKLFPEDHS